MGDFFLQRLDRARFADTSLADHGDDLTLARAGEPPALEHQPHFVRTTDERQRAGTDRGEAALDHRFAKHTPGGHGVRKTFEFVRAGGFKLEQSAEQTLRRLADENRVGLGEGLQSRGKVGRLSDNGTFLCRAGANDFADHDQAGSNPDPGARPRTVRQLDAADFAEDVDRRANGAFSGILESARKAEIGQDAVAHELGDETAEAADRAGGGILITADHAAKEFGIDRVRQRRRTHHVAEQHRDLAALGV
jgi:hypothetical protein